jgi:SNF family Na+-dependent transporter
MNIQDIIAIIFLVPVGFVAIGSAVSLLCLPFHYLSDYLHVRNNTL